MRKILLLLVMAALWFAGAANAFTYSPLGLGLDVGGGMKWQHFSQGDLDLRDAPFISGTLGKELAERWYISGTFERAAVSEANYEIRAGIYYRIGPGERRY